MKQLLIILLFATSLLLAKFPYVNALIDETSPYLQQHAHNPVDWYPWGEEAFLKAKKEKKMIFLSIGYSTCHWCHVMEEESFVDTTVSDILNKYFINIKVDRETYPQIDKKYQKLYHAYHKSRGGWPLSVFMTPQAEVIHLATYIPKEEGYGSIGLFKTMEQLITLQKEHKLTKEAQKYKNIPNHKKTLKKAKENLLDTVEELENKFDTVNGGFSFRPKYPEASKISLLFDIYQLGKTKEVRDKAFMMATTTLTKMARGGIYDQVGGAFFRYTTDIEWEIPHFEKMLYTNAELISVYLRAYQLSKDELYKKVTLESIDAMERDFAEAGVYFSASDADSDGEEGGYFIYAYLEVKKELLGQGLLVKDVEEGLAYLGIEDDGNIDGDYSLAHISVKKKPKELENILRHFKELRKTRTFPFVDKKINTAWNAMMIKSLFEASTLDKKYGQLAEMHLSNLLQLLRVKGVLYHQTLLGIKPTQKALLEDYAFLIDALLVGYEHTYNNDYLNLATSLTHEGTKKFYRQQNWYMSDDGMHIEADFDDRYYTAALSVMLENMIRLASLSEDLDMITLVKNSVAKRNGEVYEKKINISRWRTMLLRLDRGDIIIKSSKSKLENASELLSSLGYPFLLTKVADTATALACRVNSCFAYDKTIKGLMQKIKKSKTTLYDNIVSLAKEKLNSPYVYGKAGPKSFDCSGFVYFVFKQHGLSLSRTALAQSKEGKKLARESLEKGDILFFDTSDKGVVNHSGIYLGDDMFIHASSGKAKGVTTSSLNAWYKDKFKWGIRKFKKVKHVNDE